MYCFEVGLLWHVGEVSQEMKAATWNVSSMVCRFGEVVNALHRRKIDSVVDVVRVNERIMYEKLVIGKQIVNIIAACAPHVGLRVAENDIS